MSKQSDQDKPPLSNTEEVPDPELDDLLDDALKDFSKPAQARATSGTGGEGAGGAPTGTDLASTLAAMGIGAAVGGPGAAEGDGAAPAADTNNIWTEEFIQQATANFEKTMRAIMEHQQGQDKPPPAEAPTTGEAAPPPVDLSALSAQFAQFAEAATKAASESPSDADFTQTLADTMKQLGENNEQLQSAPTPDDLNKMFENMGLTGGGDDGEGGAMGGLFPLMQVMLENILSKDVLYSPMKELTEKYPDWLADHRTSLPEEEYTRYNKQYDVMKQIVDMYEEEKDSDSDEVRGQRFEKIMIAMQKLQEMGQPPKDLVGDMGPMISFDESGNPVLPDMSSLLGSVGFPGSGAAGMPDSETSAGAPDQQQPGQEGEQCTLM